MRAAASLSYGHPEDRTPTNGYEPTREAAMAIGSTPCSALPATTWALGTMRTGANYSLWMVGRQASMAGRPACRIYPERGWGRGRRRCDVGREEDSDQRCQDFYF